MGLKENFQSMVNALLSLLSFVVIIFIFSQLWGYIYGNSIQVINGYSLDQMLWYLIGAEMITYSSSSKWLVRGISGTIKSGQIAYMMNKPYNFFIYQISYNFSEQLFKILLLFPTGVLLGFLLLGGFPTGFEWFHIFPIFVSIVMAFFVSSCLYGTIGLLSFWIEDAEPFTWIVSKTFLIFGVFFPPEFFPGALSKVIEYSPVYVSISGPAKLLSSFTWEAFGILFLFQMIYLVIFYTIATLVFNAGKRRLVVNGG